ncbi:MAG: hypothetical protein ACRDG7_04570 [Candidatus Limnocylindria bacterium]
MIGVLALLGGWKVITTTARGRRPSAFGGGVVLVVALFFLVGDFTVPAALEAIGATSGLALMGLGWMFERRTAQHA